MLVVVIHDQAPPAICRTKDGSLSVHEQWVLLEWLSYHLGKKALDLREQDISS
jgi:hypothetical protein